MKRKFKFRIEYIIIILLIILSVMLYLYFNGQNGNTTTNSSEQSYSSSSSSTDESTKTSIVQASIQTITNTLSASGEISSGLTENLSIHSTYYFSEIYYEENDYVEEGEKILKYTNGTYMTAPYNLVITKINVPEASAQCTSKHYIEVKSTDTLTMSASIDEDNLSVVKVGQEAQITVSAIEENYTGYITNISQTGKYFSNGSTFTATITFSNNGSVKIGMSGAAQIVLEKAQDVVTVPKEAVQTSGTSKYVVVVDDNNETQNVTVETGISNDAYTEIKSGLEGNENVQITQTTSTNNKSSMMMQGGSMSQGMERPSGSGSNMAIPGGTKSSKIN